MPERQTYGPGERDWSPASRATWKLSPIQKEIAIEMYQGGLKVSQIARLFGVHQCTVHGLLVRRGIKL
jgi:DNA-directed RNA polymerase specialized sigma24 family protein